MGCLVSIVLGGLIYYTLRVIYSIFFSPLKSIPSPLIFQIFPAYYKYISARGYAAFVIHEYHLQYGKAIRVGWDTVLFFEHDAATTIYGNYSFDRAPMYKGFNYFGESLISVLSRDLHSERKKILAPAFARDSLPLLESRIVEVGLKGLMAVLDSGMGQNINLLEKSRFMMWDITCDISLGGSLGMLQGHNHVVALWMRNVLHYGFVCASFPILKAFKPSAFYKLKDMQTKMMEKYFQQRKSNPQESMRSFDTFYDQKYLTPDQLFAEAHMLLIAGTNTTSSAIAFAIYLVLKNPSVKQELLSQLRDTPGHISYSQCKDILYLEAIIHETLRLFPVVAVATLRSTPKSGRNIGGYFIPENTEVGSPAYTLHRSPQLWEDADKFLPERWIKDGKIINHKNYMPFSKGPRSCLGKDLAWLEMKLILANLFRNYAFTLVDPDEVFEFTASPVLQPISGKIMINVQRTSEFQ